MPLTKPPVADEADEGPEPTRKVFGPPRVKLVASGSGLRFYAQLGALARLMELGFLVEESMGTSGGAVCAAVAATGMSPSEIRESALRLLPRDLIRPASPFQLPPNLARLLPVSGGVERSSLSQGAMGVLDSSAILGHFRRSLPSDFAQCIAPCHVVTSNWTRKSQPTIWSSGDLPLCVYASMSLPVFDMVAIAGLLVKDPKSNVLYGFNARAPTREDLERKPGVGQSLPNGCVSSMPELYQDGGVTGNFWIDFDQWRVKSDAPVVGLRVRGSDEPCLRQMPKTKLERVVNTLSDLVDGQDREKIEDSPDARVCYVETRYSGFDVSLGRDEITRMMQDGAAAIERFLDSALL